MLIHICLFNKETLTFSELLYPLATCVIKNKQRNISLILPCHLLLFTVTEQLRKTRALTILTLFGLVWLLVSLSVCYSLPVCFCYKIYIFLFVFTTKAHAKLSHIKHHKHVTVKLFASFTCFTYDIFTQWPHSFQTVHMWKLKDHVEIVKVFIRDNNSWVMIKTASHDFQFTYTQSLRTSSSSFHVI